MSKSGKMKQGKGSPKGGSSHSTVKKVGAMNNTNTMPQSFQNPQQAQAATGNGSVNLPPSGQSINPLGQQDWGAEKMPAGLPSY